MPDIFDEVAESQGSARDLFDEVAEESLAAPAATGPQRDIFDEIAEEAPGAPSMVGDLANRFRRGGAVAIGNTLQAVPRLGHAVAQALGADLPDAQQQETLRAESPMFRLGEAIAEGAREAFPVDPRREGKLPAVLAESGGGMIPTIATGVAGRVAAALQYGLGAGEQAAQEAVAAGRPETATKAFLATAPIGALTEGALGVAPGVARMLRDGVRGSVAGAAVRGAGREALQEGLEQMGGNFVASGVAGYDPERSLGQGVPTAMAAGGILGGGVNAGVQGLRNLSLPQEQGAEAPQRGAARGPDVVMGDPDPGQAGYRLKREPVIAAAEQVAPVELQPDPTWQATPPDNHRRAREIARGFQGTSVVNGPTGWPVLFNAEGLEHTLYDARHPAHFQSVGALPDLLRNAVLVGSEPDAKGRQHIRQWHTFAARMNIGAEPYVVRLMVKELADGRRFYDHEVLQKTKPALSRETREPDGSSGDSFRAGPGQDASGADGSQGAGPLGDPLAMPPVPPGVPVTGAPRMPVAMERIVEGSVDLPTIMASLEAAVQAWGGHTPLRTGRFRQRARGIYNPQSDVARLNSADNLPTATHEVGHALAEHIWGDVGRAEFRRMPKPLRDELMAMGRALYGNTKPAGGYLAEGWAEFVRMYLTTEDAPTKAPGLTRWFEGKVLPTNPAGRKALEQVRALTDIWRGQGARGRALAQMKPEAGGLAKLRDSVKRLLTKRNFVDDAEPLRLLSKTTEEIIGHRLPMSQDPYLLLTAKRGTAGAILDRFLYDGPVDAWGNAVQGAHSLQDAIAPVVAGVPNWPLKLRKDRLEDFSLYLWARRAQERWSKKKNPGISLDDANHLRAQLETPAFQLAADRYYKWWDSVLDYYGSARPENADLVRRIRAGSDHYAPLARVLEPDQIKPGSAGRAGGGLARMHGSGLPIKDIFESTLSIAQRLIERAHRDMVLESILDIAQHRGTGVLVEEVPRSRVEQVAPFSALRQSLEDLGLNTQGVPDDELVTYWSHAVTPKGSAPIVARKVGGETKWFQVPPEVYEILEGMEPKRLGPLLDLTLAEPVRWFKLGTTGIRPSFALTNLLRDFPTMLAQTVSDRNAVQRLAAYLGGWGEVIRNGLEAASLGSVQTSTPLLDVYRRLGLEGAQWLGNDANRLRKAKSALVHGRLFRQVTQPIETLREIVNAAEVAPRLAELGSVGADLGWTPGQPLTPDQAVALAVAARRITTDFAAGGRLGRVINQLVPFWNAQIQGTRGFLRAAAGDRDIGKKATPARAAARFALAGISIFMLPALVNWWRNKDEEWYHALPWRERLLYTNVLGDDGVVIQVPRSQEWGALFMALPEALFDAAYHQDPTAVVEAFKHVMELLNPFRLPLQAQVAKEQWQNRVDFFNRPIVPEGERFLKPGEQRGPYTSWLAQTLGDAFPDTISPRRVDHLVRSFLGGAYSDITQVPDVAQRWQLGTAEASDLPVVGRLFRRGGQYSAANQHLMDVYDLRQRWTSRRRDSLSATDVAWVRSLSRQVEELQAAHRIANQTKMPDARRRIYERMSSRAQRILADARRSKRLD